MAERTGVPFIPGNDPLVRYLDDLERRLKAAEATIASQATTITSLDTTLSGLVGDDETIIDPFTSALLHVQEQTASGTDGKSLSSGVWTIRDTTTVITNEIGATVDASTGAITLPAGSYYVDISVPAFMSSTHRARLQVPLSSTTLLLGTSARPAATLAGSSTSESLIKGRFVLAETTTIEIQTQPSASASGFDAAAISGVLEIGTNALFWKVG